MVVFLDVCLFIVIISIQYSQIKADVKPTISNSTGQYFITNDTLKYDSETIACSHPSLCYFECNVMFGCSNLVLNISSASNVVINCNDWVGCHGNFNLSVIDNLFINCNGDRNCDDLNVYTNVVNDNTIIGTTAYINLTNPSDWASTGNNYFNLKNIDVVNMQCAGNDACFYTTLYCPSHRENACNVRCKNGACPAWTNELLIVNENYTLNWLTYSSDDDVWINTVRCMDHFGKENGQSALIMTYNDINVCKYYSNCCPYSSVKINNDNYENGWHINDCIEGYDCFVDCSSRYTITGVLSECGYRIINGSLSKSVTVICPDTNSCDNTRVICPINGGECNVNVTAKDGSTALRINANGLFIGNDLNINLNCLADNSCYDTYIFANNTIGSNINMKINCVSTDISSYHACRRLVVDGSSSDLNNIDIKYQRRGVVSDWWYDSDKFYLYRASNVNIHCNGILACERTVFNLENTSNIDIRCDGITVDDGGSCLHTEFYVGGATNIDIECMSNNCRETRILAADSNKLDLVCDGDQACTDMLISYPPILNQYVFTLKCYDGIFDYSCNGIRIYLQDDFIENFIDIVCESNKACHYIYFQCDTKGVSILNPDDNYHSCLTNNCCPFNGIRSETNKPTTSMNSLSTIPPMNEITSANAVSTIQPTAVNTVITVSTIPPMNEITSANTVSTIQPIPMNADNDGLPTSPLVTTYNPDHSDFRSETSMLNSSWIILIIAVCIFVFICAIYIAYKMGIKKQIKKQQPVIPSFQLVEINDHNNAEGIDNVQDIDTVQ